jgi:IS5 family transposase
MIHTPKPFNKDVSTHQHRKLKEGFQRRASIEPVVGHLKSDYRLIRNYCKGIFGDNIHLMLAAAAMNFKRMINIWKEMFICSFLQASIIIQKLVNNSFCNLLFSKTAF